jgi:uncharacterized YigZ family protein
MLAEDEYQTITAPVVTEFKEKGSRFIGHLFPLTERAEAEKRLNEVRQKHFNATHNCYAWHWNTETFRYSDDGEPNGTAGKPIYNMLNGSGLLHLLCVVTRYYGGTMLGTGGLIRAYGQAARNCLDEAHSKTVIQTSELRIVHGYDETSPVMHWLEKYEGTILQSEYDQKVVLTIRMRLKNVDIFTKQLIEATNNSVKIKAI